MKHKVTKTKKIIIIITAILVVLFGCSAIYLGNYYHSVDVEKYMSSSPEAAVEKFDEGWFFDGAGEEKALIFYPGAKVATEAYAPIMYELAENGIDCFLVDMPFHMAFFGMNRAEDIMQEYDYKEWYLGGHSLGGAMAAILQQIMRMTFRDYFFWLLIRQKIYRLPICRSSQSMAARTAC